MKLYVAAKLAADAFRSTYRNPSVSIAGVLLSLIAFLSLGFAVSIYYNVDRNVERIMELPEMEVFLYPDADEEERASLEEKLLQTPGVLSMEYVSKDMAFEKAKKIVGEDSEVLDTLGKDFLPESFIIDIDNDFDFEDVITRISAYGEIESINYSSDEIEFINKISEWSKYVAAVIFAASLFFSFVTISALVRITVYSRKKEIMVKRYLGANNSFILLPFILEGVIISLIGAVLSLVILFFTYDHLTTMYKALLSDMSLNIFEVVPVGEIKYFVVVFVAAASVVFGLMAGLYAVGRHLRLGGH